MLSRFLVKAGKQGSLCLRVIGTRTNSTSTPVSTTSSDIKIVDMNYPARLMDWENFKMPGAPYYGNGPLPPLLDFDKKIVRHYIIPEYWFEFLYPRTGGSGPYTLFAGLSILALSKEYYIVNDLTNNLFGFILAYIFVLKTLGPYISDYFEKERELPLLQYDQVKNDELTELIQSVEEIKLEQWRAQGQELINDARRSNLSMMLETEYLNRQATVVDTVTRMLDYQVAVQKVENDIEQEHMVNWIEKKVAETITPQTQKATLDACITQLNAMAGAK